MGGASSLSQDGTRVSFRSGNSGSGLFVDKSGSGSETFVRSGIDMIELPVGWLSSRLVDVDRSGLDRAGSSDPG